MKDKKEKTEQEKELIKMYWRLRKAGSPDWMGGGIYMSEGIYLTREGKFIHTRN
jgi:hypothetical protein